MARRPSAGLPPRHAPGSGAPLVRLLPALVAGALLLLVGRVFAPAGGKAGRIRLPTGHVLPRFASEVLVGMEGDPFTFFAPPEEELDSLLEALGQAASPADARRLRSQILLSHVVADERLVSGDLKPGARTSRTALSGLAITVSRGKSGLGAEAARAVVADVALGDGVVHVVDALVVPPALRASLEDAGVDAAALGEGADAADAADADDGADADDDDAEAQESGDEDGDDAGAPALGEDGDEQDEDGDGAAVPRPASSLSGLPDTAGSDVSELERKRLEQERESLRHANEKKSLEALSSLLKGKQRERDRRRQDGEDEDEDEDEEGAEAEAVVEEGSSNDAGEGEEDGDAAEVVKNKSTESDAERQHASEQRCYFHGTRAKDGTCACSALYAGDFCEKLAPELEWATAEPYRFTYVMSQARLANEAKDLSLGTQQVSLKIETPVDVQYIVEELTARTYGNMYPHLPASDPFVGQLHDSCAVVGSSGSVMRNNFGNEIDKHSVVMRFNLAPTVGYEEHVGTKTTIRVSEMDYFPFRESTEMIVALVPSEAALDTYMEYRTAKPDDKSFFFAPEFVGYVAKTVGRGSIPSVGTLGLFLMMHTCRSVTVYGFHQSERHGARYHYYSKDLADAARITATKNFAYDLSAALHRAGALRLVEPCLRQCQVSLAKCGECQGMSVPELFRQQELSPAHETANAEHMARWEAQKEDWRKLLPPPPSVGGAVARPRSSRRHGRGRNDGGGGPKVEDDAALINLGWSYLITTGRIEDLSADGLGQYFAHYDLPMPESKLERIMEVYRHYYAQVQ